MEDDSCPDLVFHALKTVLLCIDVHIYIRTIKNRGFNILIYMKGKYTGDDSLLLPKATCGA